MELSKEDKQDLLDEFIGKAKTALISEAKSDIEKITNLITETRKAHDDMLKGYLTEADFKTYQEKSLTEEGVFKGRIDAIETKMNRLPIAGKEGSEVVEGAPEYKSAFFGYVRSGQFDLSDAKASAFLGKMLEAKALVSDELGGILLPEELESEIYRALPKLNVIRALATVRTTTRDKIRRRSLTEVEVGWGKLETGTEVAETDAVPSEAFQYVEDLEGMAKIGKDELADTDISLASILTDSFARAQAETEETGFVIGTGHGFEQPEGLLNGTTITRIETAAAGAIDFNALLALVYAVPAQYRRNGTFLAASASILAMRQIVGTDGQYVWQPSAQAGQPESLFGYPIVAQEDFDTIADVEGDLALFGDIRAGYRIIDRSGMTLQWLRELYATAGLIGLLVSKRVTGGIIRSDAMRVLKEHSA